MNRESGDAVQILDSTLRDGTYEIDFQLSLEDTALLAAGLGCAGISYIEVSHGNGVGLARWKRHTGGVRAAFDDEAHIATALLVSGRAQVVAFMVIGDSFAPPSELDRLYSLGVRIVRLGVEPQDLNDATCLSYIDHAKRLGFVVSVNVMQAYNVPFEVLARCAAETARRGADWFVVVDSAGAMNPEEVRQYVRAVKDASGLRVGIHTHNNGGLALANALAAVDAGATLVDSTLQGVGRATGNPVTEQLLLAMQHRGHERGVDRELVFKLGDLARTLIAEKGQNPTHFVSGAARLHSRFVPGILATAAERGLPAREFMYQLGRRMAARGPEVISIQARSKIESELHFEVCPVTLPDGVYTVAGAAIEQRARVELAPVCDELFMRATKLRKRSVLYLAPADQFFFEGVLPWESGALVGVTVPWAGGLGSERPVADRLPHLLAYDPAAGAVGMVAPFAPQRQLRLRFASVVADGAAELAAHAAAGRPIRIVGEDPLAEMISRRLEEAGAALAGGAEDFSAKVVVAPAISAALLRSLEPGQVLVLYGRPVEGAREQARQARERGGAVIRPMLGAATAARVEAWAAVDRRMASPLTAVRHGSVLAVDPLLVPSTDEVVVDSVIHPSTILDSGASPTRAIIDAIAHARIDALLAGPSRKRSDD